ncbi:hypothetical protein EXS54_02110 [Patescibacteria group bacterium]|nr:hypothetical protein [Patescibacteria group bacterium]
MSEHETSPAEHMANRATEQFAIIREEMGPIEEVITQQIKKEGAAYPRDLVDEVSSQFEHVPVDGVSIMFWKMINDGSIELGVDRLARLS